MSRRQGVTQKVWKGRGWSEEEGARREEEKRTSATFFYLANVLSNAPAARDRRAPKVRATHCVKTFGHCYKRQLQAEERRNVGQSAKLRSVCDSPASSRDRISGASG